MIAYIQTDRSGECYNVNAFVARDGFTQLGWDIRKFLQADDITDPDPEILVVGGIGNVRRRLEQIGRPKQGAEIDYPQELEKYLGRKVWTSTIGAVRQAPGATAVFIKPKTHTKAFAGKVVSAVGDLIGFGLEDDAYEIWCSEVVEFRTEWRCFVRYGALFDVRLYKGAWDSRIDLSVVNAAIADFKSAPAAYALDFGVDAAGRMRLVEVNDGHSLGSYGMGSVSYAKFLSARWAQMSGTKDDADF